jgi:hypothetical protein
VPFSTATPLPLWDDPDDGPIGMSLYRSSKRNLLELILLRYTILQPDKLAGTIISKH